MKNLDLGKNENSSKGITLVALVISIIVLLILATVSIQTLTGNNGLLSKTKTAVQSNKDSQEEEKVKLAVAAAQLDGNGILTEENLNIELQKVFSNEDTVIECLEYYIFRASKNYIIYKNGTVKKSNALLFATIKDVELSNIIINFITPNEMNAYKLIIYNSNDNSPVEYEITNNTIDIPLIINMPYSIKIYGNDICYNAKFKINGIQIAREGETIYNLSKGYYAYGNNQKYYYKYLSGTQTFSNSNWGEPCFGIAKFGYRIEEPILYDEKVSKFVNIDIMSSEDDTYQVNIYGEKKESIKKIMLYQNEDIVFEEVINNKNYSILTQLKGNENYILEISYYDESREKIKIKLERNENFEEKKLGEGSIHINTQDKWYYLKYGANNSWKYKWFYSEDLEVNNSTMGGDPAFGAQKSTYLIDVLNIIIEKN